jgi:hypothetical protein
VSLFSLDAPGYPGASSIDEPSSSEGTIMRHPLLFVATLVLAISSSVACADVSYEVIKESTLPGVKRSLDVRLSEPVDEATLRKIAMGLLARDSRNHERTFIVYYLPGMEVGAGGWSTTHFNPELKVQILGMTREQEDALASKGKYPQVLGTWISQGTGAATITIERSPEGLLLRQRFKGGGELAVPLKEAYEPQPGKQYHYKKGSDLGEYLRIDRAGDLGFWNQDGLIRTAKRRSSASSPEGGDPVVKVPDVLPHGQELVETHEGCVSRFRRPFRDSRTGLPRYTNCVSYAYQPLRCCKGKRMLQPQIAVYTFSSAKDARYGLLDLLSESEYVNSAPTYLRIMEKHNPRAEWLVISEAYSASPIRDLYVAGDGDAVLFQLGRYLVVVKVQEHPEEQIYQLKIAKQVCSLNALLCDSSNDR